MYFQCTDLQHWFNTDLCVCVSKSVSALDFFCLAVWNSRCAQFSPEDAAPSLSFPFPLCLTHLARPSVHTLQCLYTTALQIISWLQCLSPFLPLVTNSLLSSSISLSVSVCYNMPPPSLFHLSVSRLPVMFAVCSQLNTHAHRWKLVSVREPLEGFIAPCWLSGLSHFNIVLPSLKKEKSGIRGHWPTWSDSGSLIYVVQ